MTRERAKQLLPVIQAFADGKAIEFKRQDQGEWSDAKVLPTSVLEFCDGYDYRIKPEPRRFWIEVRGFEPSNHVVWFNNPKYVKVNPEVIEVVEVVKEGE